MQGFCDYYMVCTSPWTYLGHARLIAMANAHHISVRIKPINLGQIFVESGGLPLAKRAPQRQAYRLVELERWRSFSGLPLNIHPKFFPADDRLAARCVIAVQRREGAARALALAGALLQSVWAEEGNIADESQLRELMQGLGLSVDEVLADAVSDTVHALYEENTQEALEAKVFGAPWYVFEGIPYWGQDRLDFLERAFAASESRAA